MIITLHFKLHFDFIVDLLSLLHMPYFILNRRVGHTSDNLSNINKKFHQKFHDHFYTYFDLYTGFQENM